MATTVPDRSTGQLAAHPCRNPMSTGPRRTHDQAKVEAVVLPIERWISGAPGTLEFVIFRELRKGLYPYRLISVKSRLVVDHYHNHARGGCIDCQGEVRKR